MKLMSTYGNLTELPNQKNTWRWYKGSNGTPATVKQFKYTEPFANHYLYRHCVDHNNLRHSVPSIEGTIKTHCWENRVFSFLLAISEVNAYLAMKEFVWEDKKILTLHEFRRKLALELINNEWIYSEESSARKKRAKRTSANATELIHELHSAPPHAKKFLRKKWDLSCKSKYQQYTCGMPGCIIKTRTYCACNVGHWICKSCHPKHIVDEMTKSNKID